MESKGGKKKSSSSSKSLFYEVPLGYSIEDLRPAGGIKKFRSAAYSNVSCMLLDVRNSCFSVQMNVCRVYVILYFCAVCAETILN
ncbi:hypothetical protein I3843_04G005000 [Carya illinoinensis]|nr:hypothetical protein I3843_04G005000 [Carya illinoinensis]